VGGLEAQEAGMAAVLVTGSSDGIGRQTARDLIDDGHRVVVHARNDRRADEARNAVPGAADVVVGDVSSIAGARAVTRSAATLGDYDAVIHNVGVGGASERGVTDDGFERTFAVNVLAPYILTCLIPRPARLVYLTSGLESRGEAHLDDLQFERRPWNGMQAYSDSKFWDVVLAFAVARHWPGTLSNAVDPGWIRTRMGGPSATDDLPEGAETQVWLATSDDPAATVTGRYLKRRQDLRANPAAYDPELQERFLETLSAMTGVTLPEH
jgi:NAD(P)-dependent dehydrogenase (short-subunit alcohol dehydrogenase family)